MLVMSDDTIELGLCLTLWKLALHTMGFIDKLEGKLQKTMC